MVHYVLKTYAQIGIAKVANNLYLAKDNDRNFQKRCNPSPIKSKKNVSQTADHRSASQLLALANCPHIKRYDPARIISSGVVFCKFMSPNYFANEFR